MNPGTTSGTGDYEYTPHPCAVMLPERSGRDYEDLKTGIRLHGLQYPIEVQKGTRNLLKGRHRLRACRELGVEPKVQEVEIEDRDVAIYTGAEAANRPGLTPTQKALVALEVLPECEKRAADRKYLGLTIRYGEQGKAAAIAGALVGVSTSYVELAARLKKKHPELFERVRDGELDLLAARRELEGKEPKKPEPKEDRFLAWRLPDYLRERLTFTNQSGKLQCVAKDDLRRLLGRSPDRLDAVLMACTGPTEIDFSSVSLGGPVAF